MNHFRLQFKNKANYIVIKIQTLYIHFFYDRHFISVLIKVINLHIKIRSNGRLDST